MVKETIDNIAKIVCYACEFCHDFSGDCDIGDDYHKCSICQIAAKKIYQDFISKYEEGEHKNFENQKR